jgi:hypothetical protein
VATAAEQGLFLIKPSRFGSGAYMTVAMLSGDFPTRDESGLVNINATLKVLHQARSVIQEAVTHKLSTTQQ